jgi:hypothetical protein
VWRTHPATLQSQLPRDPKEGTSVGDPLLDRGVPLLGPDHRRGCSRRSGATPIDFHTLARCPAASGVGRGRGPQVGKGEEIDIGPQMAEQDLGDNIGLEVDGG